MEYTEATAQQYVKDILLKNGFTGTDKFFKKGIEVMVVIQEDHYVVSHYDHGFMEWMDWHSPDLVIYSLLGYLSFYDFIERGYKK